MQRVQDRAPPWHRDRPLRQTAELAGAIAFLLSPAAGYMTGELVHVDGGLRLPKGILGGDA